MMTIIAMGFFSRKLNRYRHRDDTRVLYNKMDWLYGPQPRIQLDWNLLTLLLKDSGVEEEVNEKDSWLKV